MPYCDNCHKEFKEEGIICNNNFSLNKFIISYKSEGEGKIFDERLFCSLECAIRGFEKLKEVGAETLNNPCYGSLETIRRACKEVYGVTNAR